MTKLSIRYQPLDEIKLDPRNPKDHDIPRLRKAVERFGYAMSIKVDDRTGLLSAGHGRVELLREMWAAGETPPPGVTLKGTHWMVPVEVGWASADDTEALAFLITANRQEELGGWADAVLARELQELAESGFGLEGVGFDDKDLRRLLGSLDTSPKPNQAASSKLVHTCPECGHTWESPR